MNESETYTGRHECSFVQVGNMWFLFGGRESPTRLEAYDYTQNSWSVKSPPPQPFNHFQALQFEGLLWVIGSFRHNGFPKEEPAEHVHVYDAAQGCMDGGSSRFLVHEVEVVLLFTNTSFISWEEIQWDMLVAL